MRYRPRVDDTSTLAEPRDAHAVGDLEVLWSVTGDPHFLDHWAVRVEGQQVIDPTFLWSLRWRLFRCDLGRGPALHSVHRLTHALLSTAKFCFYDSARRLRGRLESRHNALVASRAMNGQPVRAAPQMLTGE